MGSRVTTSEGISLPPRKDDSAGGLSRREFLNKGIAVAGWGVMFASLGAGLYQGLRFLYPAVVFHPPSIYVIGQLRDFVTDERPDQYGVIFVDPRF